LYEKDRNRYSMGHSEHTYPLKVDGNEKWGGSGRKQKISFCPALQRSGVILNLNVPFLLKLYISVSACYSFLNRHCLDK
jgi:hypothetical protein